METKSRAFSDLWMPVLGVFLAAAFPSPARAQLPPNPPPGFFEVSLTVDPESFYLGDGGDYTLEGRASVFIQMPAPNVDIQTEVTSARLLVVNRTTGRIVSDDTAAPCTITPVGANRQRVTVFIFRNRPVSSLEEGEHLVGYFAETNYRVFNHQTLAWGEWQRLAIGFGRGSFEVRGD